MLPCIRDEEEIPDDCLKNKIMKFTDEWRELENIKLSEEIHIQKEKFHMCFLASGSFLVPNLQM